MPHADSSFFEPGLSKEQVYAQVVQQARGLVEGQRNWLTVDVNGWYFPFYMKVSNLANISSLLWHAYASLSSNVNWAGFYVRSDKFPPTKPSSTPEQKATLLLGPFSGKPACQLIHFGAGVCGTAAADKRTVLVPDVLSFPGHIACDAESRSEIVVPILVEGETVAIIDVDCTEKDGFDERDRDGLEDVAKLIAECCDW